MTELKERYDKKLQTFKRAEEQLSLILKEAVGRIDNKQLVRAEVRAIRIKSLASLERKAAKNGWGADEAIVSCSDIIGGRVVCNNTEDIYRFAELLKEIVAFDDGSFETQDKIKNPADSGYRALHVHFRLNVSEMLGPELIPCEVQIRTRLQDSWAELSHEDIYKQGKAASDLFREARNLAEVLTAADKIASDIRSRAMQSAASPDGNPRLDRVTSEGLSHVFGMIFGRSLPDYVLQQALTMCENLGITSLENLPIILGRQEFRDRLLRVHRAAVGWPPSNEDVFLSSVFALSRGEKRAVRRARRHAQREAERLASARQSDFLGTLPDTVDDLLEQIEEPEKDFDIGDWADAVDAVTKCAVCGTSIVSPEVFAEGIVEHYEVPEGEVDEIQQRIEAAVRGCGVETGGWDNSALCAHCAHQFGDDS